MHNAVAKCYHGEYIVSNAGLSTQLSSYRHTVFRIAHIREAKMVLSALAET